MNDIILQFTIPINPVTKKNSLQILYNKRTNQPFISQSKAYKQYEEDVGIFIKGRGMMIDYPVIVKAIYYRKTRHVVDLANLNSALHDILVKYGVLLDDNYKILVSSDGSRVKFDKDNPRTEVTISRYDEDE